jgi:hypothetical protein
MYLEPLPVVGDEDDPLEIFHDLAFTRSGSKNCAFLMYMPIFFSHLAE